MKLLVATSNPHKLDEIRAICEQCETEQGGSTADFQFVSLADIGLHIPEPIEDGDTFEANAVLKAKYYADASNMLCVADDSGLEVDALDGAPGVISARYAGADGSRDVVDPANNRKLIKELADTPAEQRTARFVCTMAMCKPREAEPLVVVRGTFEGRILTQDEAGADAQGRGEDGFGYDPLFYVPEFGCTSAELSPQRKNAISHRGNAVRLFLLQLTQLTRSG